MSFDLIIPHISGLEHLLLDPEISEIMVNPGGVVFIERAGNLLSTAIKIEEHKLEAGIRSIARVLGKDVSEKLPLLDARLPDGSRVAATYTPVSIGGCSLTIRKFPARRFTAEELIRLDMLTPQQLYVLRRAVEKRATILISGGTGTGKSTLLNALAEFIPSDERIILIEDVSEISLTQPNVVRLEARQELPGVPEVSIRMLLRMALRMRPSRVLLGEVRGPEAADLLQALNTGHEGSISTIHSNSAHTAGTRLRDCVLQSGPGMSPASVSASIASAIQVLVHIERRAGKRYVKEMVKVRGYNSNTDTYDLENIKLNNTNRKSTKGETEMNYKETASRYIKENFADDDRLAVVLIERERQLVEQKFVTAEQLASEKYLRHLASSQRTRERCLRRPAAIERGHP